jgi:hypothetical protein
MPTHPRDTRSRSTASLLQSRLSAAPAAAALLFNSSNFYFLRRQPPPIVRVPVREQARDYTQRVIELVTDLAVADGRYAVEVLDEILQQQIDAPAVAGNGHRLNSKLD